MSDGWVRMIDDRFHYIMEGTSMCGEYIAMPRRPLSRAPVGKSCSRCLKSLKIFDKVLERFQDDDVCIKYPESVKRIIRNTLEAVR